MNTPTPPKLPQPIDYGLTYGETFNGLWVGGERKYREELPECGFTKFTYKQGEWMQFGAANAVALWLLLYIVGFTIFALYNSIPGGWTWSNPRAFAVFFLGMVFPGAFPGVFLVCIICAVVETIRENRARRNPSEPMLAFRRALSEYSRELSAYESACKSALIAARRKHAYWEALDGYQFEIATAKVLGLHRFNPTLTGGPADGGIDIDVHRDGVRGVVQCKAHAAPVGPHTVRDLFGVMHDSRAGFGIVASRTGFTPGAVEFARGKPIFLIGVSELVAMAEGKDVFDSIFTRPNTALEPTPTAP